MGFDFSTNTWDGNPLPSPPSSNTNTNPSWWPTWGDNFLDTWGDNLVPKTPITPQGTLDTSTWWPTWGDNLVPKTPITPQGTASTSDFNDSIGKILGTAAGTGISMIIWQLALVYVGYQIYKKVK